MEATGLNTEADENLEAGIAACENFVKLWREKMVLTDEFSDLINGDKGWWVTHKLHGMESHVHEFALAYRTVGLFSEEVIEAVHKVVKEYKRRWAAVHDGRTLLMLIEREMTTRFVHAARRHAPPKKN